MTKPKNFPGNKHYRRVSAAERLEIAIATNPLNRPETEIRRKRAELVALKERIAHGGRKTTKKVGSNLGRK